MPDHDYDLSIISGWHNRPKAAILQARSLLGVRNTVRHVKQDVGCSPWLCNKVRIGNLDSVKYTKLKEMAKCLHDHYVNRFESQ